MRRWGTFSLAVVLIAILGFTFAPRIGAQPNASRVASSFSSIQDAQAALPFSLQVPASTPAGFIPTNVGVTQVGATYYVTIGYVSKEKQLIEVDESNAHFRPPDSDKSSESVVNGMQALVLDGHNNGGMPLGGVYWSSSDGVTVLLTESNASGSQALALAKTFH